jgi:transposase InsO family protein
METPHPDGSSASAPEDVVNARERIVYDLCRRVRYLLTLKGRPPFRLAGIEMFERLNEVLDCLARLIAQRSEPQLLALHQGLSTALQAALPEYTCLRQVAGWLEQIANCLNPENKLPRSGTEVRQELELLLAHINSISQDHPRLHSFFKTIQRTTDHYAPGLFHCYDVPGLPRTNNGCESDFRDLNRRLLRTTGQKGLTRRILQRDGAWELLQHPPSLSATIQALSHVLPQDFILERQRVIQHRNRFRLHSRSAKQSLAQLHRIEQLWAQLSNDPI